MECSVDVFVGNTTVIDPEICNFDTPKFLCQNIKIGIHFQINFGLMAIPRMRPLMFYKKEEFFNNGEQIWIC